MAAKKQAATEPLGDEHRSNCAIYVVAGGHVFVGVVQDEHEQAIILNPWAQFNKLGSKDLASGIADGPKPETILMATCHRELRIRADHIRFRVDAGHAWLKKLE